MRIRKEKNNQSVMITIGELNAGGKERQLIIHLKNLQEQQKYSNLLVVLNPNGDPNACSQPQIKDIGIIGAIVPTVTEKECSQCGECLENCPDDAIVIDDSVYINQEKCMACGKCISVCPMKCPMKKRGS
ncbi:MAG: 4Fe-4S binding protein [Desulfobacterales bacterium]